jgi:hypothetical protein
MNPRNHPLRTVALATILAVCGLECCLSQTRGEKTRTRVEAQVVQVSANLEEPGERIVTVRVTVYAGDRSLVIPNCSEVPGADNGFCSAQLAKKNGKSIMVRKGLMASLGVESYDKWKPVMLGPGGSQYFLFEFSTEMMDVHKDEPIRIRFQTWPDAQSMQDWNKAKDLLSPVFRCPAGYF